MQKLGMLALVVLIALVLGGCTGGAPDGDMSGMDHSAMMTATPGAETAGSETVTTPQELTASQAMTDTPMMTATQAMTATAHEGMDHGAMNMDPDQPFDAQFIDSMIEHHQGAIAMAQQALEEAEHPELQQLAEAIIAAQTQEIEQMTAWRQSWYPDLAPTDGMGMGMGDMVIADDPSKPFDQRFIEAMISHHQGAIDMARMAQHMAEHEEIKSLAEAIITAQQAEIEQMQGWLQEWYGIGARHSPYTAQLASPVRGLSATEVADLLAGRGLGLARMAELNRHPGPRHLLDLQAELALSPEQVTAINASFAAMQTQAQQLGEQIVRQEQALSTAFANGGLNEADLENQVMGLADLYGQLRTVHLRAHLQVTPLLTREQIAAYDRLRGYTSAGDQAHDHGMGH
jgi:uncharacterized protein (DUF305 family)